MTPVAAVRGLLAAGLISIAGDAGAAPDALNVVVTIKPIHSLVTRLIEGIGTPTLLVEGAASPHAFALKPSGVRAINAADVFIRVGESVEPFTRRIVEALPADVEVVTLVEAPGVRLLPRRASGAFEADRHEHGAEHAKASANANANAQDGHIWLDPKNAKAVVDHLAEVLSRRAPQHAARLKANAAQLDAELDQLAATIAAETGPLEHKPFVVFHDAYQYFENRFGLAAVGAITVSPEVQPSAKRLTELRRKIRDSGAVCVFAEPLFQPDLVAAVTEGSDVRSATLDPEGRTLAPGGELYFELMRNLAAGLKSCLQRSS